MLSYVANVVRGESLNVGLLAIEREAGSASFSEARFIPRLEVLLKFDENADLDYLRAIFEEIDVAFRDPKRAMVFLNEMLDSFANTLSISDGSTAICLGEPTAEVDRLAERYLHSS